MKTKTYTPQRRNKIGYLTIGASELRKAYETMNPAEKSDAPDADSPYENWIHRYDGDSNSLGMSNWYGKMTAALFLALGIRLPKTLREVKAVLSKPDEYANFNGGVHLAVDLPNDNCTITCKTESGKRITFAFIPKGHGGEAGCVDIKYHDSPLPKVTNGGRELSAMHSIGFTVGHNTYDTRKIKDPTTLITVLIDDEYYQPLCPPNTPPSSTSPTTATTEPATPTP